MKVRWGGRCGWIVILLILAVFFAFGDIRVVAYRNLAHVFFTKALAADDISAMDRQARLERFLKCLHSARNQDFSLPLVGALWSLL